MFFNGELCQLFTFKDITAQQKLASEKLKNSKTKLLAASVSSSMMTPLNGIANFSELLMKGKIDER